MRDEPRCVLYVLSAGGVVGAGERIAAVVLKRAVKQDAAIYVGAFWLGSSRAVGFHAWGVSIRKLTSNFKTPERQCFTQLFTCPWANVLVVLCVLTAHFHGIAPRWGCCGSNGFGRGQLIRVRRFEDFESPHCRLRAPPPLPP